MSHWRLSHPPHTLRRPGLELDNIALVPASLLPRKAAYQAFANRLPPGELLVVLPPQETKQQQTLKTVAQLWRNKGRRVTVVVANSLRKDGQP
jgi:Mrp family chromosome partitioning ATPase